MARGLIECSSWKGDQGQLKLCKQIITRLLAQKHTQLSLKYLNALKVTFNFKLVYRIIPQPCHPLFSSFFPQLSSVRQHLLLRRKPSSAHYAPRERG